MTSYITVKDVTIICRDIFNVPTYVVYRYVSTYLPTWYICVPTYLGTYLAWALPAQHMNHGLWIGSLGIDTYPPTSPTLEGRWSSGVQNAECASRNEQSISIGGQMLMRRHMLILPKLLHHLDFEIRNSPA